MANSHFQTWYRRKVMDSTQDNDRKVAVGKFFQFLAEQKGIVNAKVLASFTKNTGIQGTQYAEFRGHNMEFRVQ